MCDKSATGQQNCKDGEIQPSRHSRSPRATVFPDVQPHRRPPERLLRTPAGTSTPLMADTGSSAYAAEACGRINRHRTKDVRLRGHFEILQIELRADLFGQLEIGRASCRERGCIEGVDVGLK